MKKKKKNKAILIHGKVGGLSAETLKAREIEGRRIYHSTFFDRSVSRNCPMSFLGAYLERRNQKGKNESGKSR